MGQVAFGKIDSGDPRQSAFSRISPNREFYAVTSPPDLNLQLSFKYELWNFEDPIVQIVNEVFAAYTLRGFWALESNAFREFNHNPEFFWGRRFDGADVPFLSNVPVLGNIQMVRVAPWEHESDGVDGKSDEDDTASWDRSYVQAVFGGFDTADGSRNYNLDVKVWRQFDGLFKGVDEPSGPMEWSDNWELQEHLGWWEIRPVFSFMGDVPDDVPFRFQAAATVRGSGWAEKQKTGGYRKGSLQIDLKYAIQRFHPIVYLQYFRGYGENIRHFMSDQRFNSDAFVDGAIKLGLQLKL